MRALLACAAVFLCCGCAREPWQPLFGEADFVRPFADDAEIKLRDEFGGEQTVRAAHTGHHYTLTGEDGGGVSAQIIPIGATPEDDYIVQYYLPSEDQSAFYYGFLWRSGDIYETARAWEDGARGALMRDYRQRIYPKVRQGSGAAR